MGVIEWKRQSSKMLTRLKSHAMLFSTNPEKKRKEKKKKGLYGNHA